MPNREPTSEVVNVLVMAAGLGTRMKSKRAKVLHELGGLPLIARVLRAAKPLNPNSIVVVVGHGAEEVKQAATAEVGALARFALQKELRGTGDAVAAAHDLLADSDSLVLILSGDVPMIRTSTLEALVHHHRESGADCTILSGRLENPTGYGRVVRDNQGSFKKIVEQKDATDEERQIKEINSGIYVFDSRKLFNALKHLKPVNKQGEYYLTDVPAIMLSEGSKISVYLHSDTREVFGINSRAELAEFENLLRRNAIRQLMTEGGVTFIDPSHAYISTEAQIGADTIIYPGVSVEGPSVIGEGC
ncbi:MAG TPA: sugar phosphate nucleotidyltransferase, partial [Pyrinomonadaceae bacterium]